MATQVSKLHHLVWQDKPDELNAALEDEKTRAKINEFDVRGNTAAHLATLLNRKACLRVLLDAGADLMLKNKAGYYVLHEARSLGDREILKLVLVKRREQFRSFFVKRSEAITKQLKELDDFYLEMKWDFSSWIPLLSRFCPDDTYKIYKKGSQMRVETTLVGFESLRFLRGNISYIYNPEAPDGHELTVVDYDKKIYECVDGPWTDEKTEERVNFMMNWPIRAGDLQTEGLAFTPKRNGLLGFGSVRTENVSGYDADVYAIENLKLLQQVRTEHQDPKLVPKTSESDASAAKADASTPTTTADKDKPNDDKSLGQLIDGPDNLENDPQAREKLLKQLDGKKDDDVDQYVQNMRKNAIKFKPSLVPPPAPTISEADYFTEPKAGAPAVHVGRPMKCSTTTRKIGATVWMSNSFPLFVEQLFPLMEIMSPSNEHFARLRDFIDLKLPRGFPIKIEIPLFGVLTARVTFQGYRIDSSFDDSMFKVPADFNEGEIKFFQN